MINQTDLKYFAELTKTLHVSRAAERLGITQPALSHSLKRIEAEAGFQLFLRSKKGLTLTAAGERLKENSEELILKWNQVLHSVQNEVNQTSGLIRFGCHTAVASYSLQSWFGPFLKKYPQMTIHFHHGLSRHMAEEVVSEKLDAAFVINPVQHPDLIQKEISKDSVTLWKNKKCQNEDVLIIEPSLLQTQDLLRKLNTRGLSFSRVVESTSLEVIADLVLAGAGIGILPEKLIKAKDEKNHVTQVKDSPVFHDRMYLVYKPEFRKLARGKAFIEAAAAKLT